MIICLGPFCIPIWNIILFLIALVRPALSVLRGLFLEGGSGADCGDESGPDCRGKVLEEKELTEQGLEPHLVEEMCRKVQELVESHRVLELESLHEWEICKTMGKRLELPILVDYYADWCSPCRHILPVFKSLCEKYEGIFVKVNYDNHSGFCGEMNIYSLPTFHCWTLTDGNSYALADKLERSDPKELENLLLKHKFKAI